MQTPSKSRQNAPAGSPVRIVSLALVATLLALAGCSADDDSTDGSSTPVANSEQTTESSLDTAEDIAETTEPVVATEPTVDPVSDTTADTEPPTTDSVTQLSVETVPPASAPADDANAPTGSILMLKLYVGDITAGEQFYSTVFGASPAMVMGDTVHILTLTEGPGLVLIQSDADDTSKHGAFIMQVPDLEAARALAVANGATEQGTIAGNPGDQPAQSIDLLDPWGNQIEILHIG